VNGRLPGWLFLHSGRGGGAIERKASEFFEPQKSDTAKSPVETIASLSFHRLLYHIYRNKGYFVRD